MTTMPPASGNPPSHAHIFSEAHMMNVASGMLFSYLDRNIRLDRLHDNGNVEIMDLQTFGLLEVTDPKTGKRVPANTEWMAEAHRAGLLTRIDIEGESVGERQARMHLLDPDLCHALDPKSTYRRRLVWRVIADELDRTDEAYRDWLNKNYGKEPSDLEFERPSPSTLRRWVRRFEASDNKPGALVARCGRSRGHSQLEPLVDRLVHEAALYYYTRKRGKMVGAMAWLYTRIKELNASLPDASGRTEAYKMPSKETLRKRINRLLCAETATARFGQSAAGKMFNISGGLVVGKRLLELVWMDATTLEQTIVFDKDWSLPACKVRITALMDSYSRVILGWCVYAGPNRAETSAEAIIACMVPSDYPPEFLEEFPGLRYLFGRPGAIMPDNELAMVGFSSLQALNDAHITLVPLPVDFPTGKAPLERFMREFKEAMAALPGTVIDPKLAKDLDYDGVEAAVLTLPEVRDHFAAAVAQHNVSESKGVDGMSPLHVWMQRSARRATPAFEPVDHVRRVLGRHHKALLTRDGIEFDGIRYCEPEAVKRLLDNMGNTSAVRSRRKDGSLTVEIDLRRHDGDIHTIDVYDTVEEKYFSVPSTQPEYTYKLTAWEHKTFRKMAKRRREAFGSQDARLKSKAISMRMIDKMAPQLAFQQRREMAALYQSTQVSRLAGKEYAPFPSDAIIVPQTVEDNGRRDVGAYSAPAEAKPKKARNEAPARAEDYGHLPIADMADIVDWDEIDADEYDSETGELPPEPFVEGESDEEND